MNENWPVVPVIFVAVFSFLMICHCLCRSCEGQSGDGHHGGDRRKKYQNRRVQTNLYRRGEGHVEPQPYLTDPSLYPTGVAFQHEYPESQSQPYPEGQHHGSSHNDSSWHGSSHYDTSHYGSSHHGSTHHDTSHYDSGGGGDAGGCSGGDGGGDGGCSGGGD